MAKRNVPHNLDAEASLLGALLLRPDMFGPISSVISVNDFYSPGHRVIYTALSNLYKNGQGVDTVTVGDEVARMGKIDAIGGPAALVDLTINVPSTASAGRYAEIVVEMANLRRIFEVASDAAERAIEMVDDSTKLIEELQAALTSIGVNIGAMPDGVWRLDDFLDRPDVDQAPWTIPGMMRAGWRVMVVAAEGIGKALALDTPIPTPNGWTTMGGIAVGDSVFDAAGRPCAVTFATPVQHDRRCFEVEFSDGSVIVADADHLWYTHTCDEREKRLPWQVRSTEEIASTLRVRKINVANHSIPVAGALEYPERELLIDPYLLGIWLGDGASHHAKVSTADPEIIEAFEDAGYVVRHQKNYDYHITGETRWDRRQSFKSALGALNLIANKHVPRVYMESSIKQRQALLQGIMDADGHITKNGTCELTLTNETLAFASHELIVGLGHKATIRESAATLNGREVSRRWRITFRPAMEVFRLPRKLDRQVVSWRRAFTRYIVSVRPVESVPVRCIQVDSPDHTYLAGHGCIPTHNTVLMRQIAMAAAQGIHPLHYQPIRPVRSLIVDLENPEDSILEVCNPIRDKVYTASKDYDPDRAWLWHKPAGINIRRRPDRVALETVIAEVRPELVCMGPLYKVYEVGANENDELAAREVMSVLDDLRTRYSFALMLEHHAPKETAGSRRKLMPYGSSFWLRWPEMGISLAPVDNDVQTLAVGRWRGDRLKNEWPIKLHRSDTWPWAGEWPDGTFNSQPSRQVRSQGAPPQPTEDIPDDDDFTPF